MKRYTFLLLAFFLTNNALAAGFISGISSTIVANVNPNPSGTATATDIKRTSPRNTNEVGSTIAPSVSGTMTNDLQLNHSNGSRNAPATKTTKTSANKMSCKTYEGKIYDQGEAGYSDCMRNIRTDRQGTRTVP